MAFELRNIRDQLKFAIERAQLVDESVPQKLSIGYLSNLDVQTYIYPLLSSFLENYPNVEIQLANDTFSELRRKLASNVYDIIVTYNFELPGMQNIHYQKLCSVNSGFLFSKKHPLAQKKNLNYLDFENTSFLLLQEEESSGRDTELYIICNVLELKNIRIKRCENIDSLLYQISLGHDITIVSDALQISHNPNFIHYLYPNAGTLPFLACAWKSNSKNPATSQFTQTLPSSCPSSIR